MKLQYHKIRGVDKSVCTAEQKIAYNMASRIYGDIRFAKAWQQYDSGKVPAFLQNDWESKAIRTYFTTWQRDYNKASAHYNEDAIFSALRAGLHDFICHHGLLIESQKVSVMEPLGVVSLNWYMARGVLSFQLVLLAKPTKSICMVALVLARKS